MFMGVTADISNWNGDSTECSLTIGENPLIEFVELPENLNQLWYSNILCGVIRGALDMVSHYFCFYS
jgi:hypothetical protein